MDVGTRSFLLVTSPTVSDALVDLLALVQRAVHFAVVLLYSALLSALEVKYFSTSLVEMMLMVCEAHLWCGGRDSWPSLSFSAERISDRSKKVTSSSVGMDSSSFVSSSDSVTG